MDTIRLFEKAHYALFERHEGANGAPRYLLESDLPSFLSVYMVHVDVHNPRLAPQVLLHRGGPRWVRWTPRLPQPCVHGLMSTDWWLKDEIHEIAEETP